MFKALLEDRRSLPYQTLLLAGIALLASTVIAIGHQWTKNPIAARLAEDLQASLAQVIPEDRHDNALLEDTLTLTREGEPITVYRARRGNRVEAVAYRMYGNGYGSSIITLVMGVDRDGRLLGVRVISHAETPGLGDKLELAKSDWILSFDGLSLTNPPPEKWAVKKDGGVFDQFTGATITPRSVVSTVKSGLEFFSAQRAVLLDETDTAEPAQSDVTLISGVSSPIEEEVQP